jgi:hypothetical protein
LKKSIEFDTRDMPRKTQIDMNQGDDGHMLGFADKADLF